MKGLTIVSFLDKKSIRVFHTHIEVFPYEKGENERIERMLSIWIDAEYRFDPMGYFIHNRILYLPRGLNIMLLEKEFNTEAITIRECSYYETVKGVKMTTPPRNRIQMESIDFLTAEGNFKNALSYSQQALILDTGDGKTYSMINAIVQLKMRAIIITHQDKIKDQWIKSYLTMTNVTEDRLVNIHGSEIVEKIMNDEIDGDYFFINHQTLKSLSKSHGYEGLENFFKKIKVGIKVYDEAHLSFRNILMVDAFSNIKKTFYLTANFDRSDPKEGRLFKKCFASVYKFGEVTKDYEEKRKHIIYVPVIYRSNPTSLQVASVMNRYGFSVINFSKYSLYEDDERTMIRHFFKIFDKACELDGKILITAHKIEHTAFIKSLLEKEYPDLGKTISTINSKNTVEENKIAKENADIICSTIKSCGTGADIKGLRCVINLEPFSSKITANQLSGRLREYAKDKDTYFFDLIDIAFPACEKQYKTKISRNSYLRKKCKEIHVMNL